MARVFSEELINRLREKLDREGFEKISTKELLVIIAAHFNDEISLIGNKVSGDVSGLRNDLDDRIERLLRGLRRAVWAIVFSFVGSLAAAIVLRILRVI